MLIIFYFMIILCNLKNFIDNINFFHYEGIFYVRKGSQTI